MDSRATGVHQDPFWIGIADRPDPSRAEMAMHIMAGMLACPIVTGSADEIAKSSVEYADALIAALARKEKP